MNNNNNGMSGNYFSSEIIPDAFHRKLRLCYISDPNSIHTQRWVGWFRRRGHTVCLLADVPLKESSPETDIIDLSEKFYAPIIRFPIWTVWIKRFLKQWHPDILHAHRVNSAGWLAAASSYHPFVLTPWGSDMFVQPQKSWVYRMLAYYTLRRANLITAISSSMEKQIVRFGVPPARLGRVRWGVELDIFSPNSSTREEIRELREKLHLPEDARIVLSPRAVRPLYNLDIIMQAIPDVIRSIPQVYFVFIEYNQDFDYKKELDEICVKFGVFEHVRWLSPTLNRRDMAKIYSMSEVMVSVPSSDGAPLSVLEAMACEKPVICSNLPVLEEFITNGENGFLVAVRQVAPLAEAIIHMLSNPDQSKEFARRSFQMVTKIANYEDEMQKMETLYLELASHWKK
jgi:glycosyltransferase involved in cell wall biosynthesis